MADDSTQGASSFFSKKSDGVGSCIYSNLDRLIKQQEQTAGQLCGHPLPPIKFPYRDLFNELSLSHTDSLWSVQTGGTDGEDVERLQSRFFQPVRR